MEIRDVIHGSILIDKLELPIIDSRYFQRLRAIKQLGFAELSYPTASHNRYVHSLGAMETATRAFNVIFERTPQPRERLRAVVRLAALLHDIGHGPLSHTSEFAMPDVRELRVPGGEAGTGAARKATHEDYTLKIILDSGLTPLIEAAGRPHGFGPKHVAALIEPAIAVDDDFFVEPIDGARVDFRPVLKQLVSSELDADRMDYLRRDSFYSGVSYGQFDFDWLVSNLTSHVKNGKCYLALQHRALYSFEDFLISRYHMFLMVYFHYKSVVFDTMLGQYFESSDCDYSLPADIEQYVRCDDAHLFAHLSRSRNPWAVRITEKKSYRMLMELHSGIPIGPTSKQEQEQLVAKVKAELGAKGVHYLSATSTGELSKYFRKPADPIFVRYDNHYSAPSVIPLEQCTDLFQRYSEQRKITRIYVSPEDYPACRDLGRGSPLRYEGSATESQGTRPL